jgi:TM2 domain-containing membrane protein YozV
LAFAKGDGNMEKKSWLATLILCFFLGYLGIHRFYTGHTVLGVVYLCTLGLLGIGVFVDFFLILFRAYKDSDGNALV